MFQLLRHRRLVLRFSVSTDVKVRKNKEEINEAQKILAKRLQASEELKPSCERHAWKYLFYGLMTVNVKKKRHC